MPFPSRYTAFVLGVLLLATAARADTTLPGSTPKELRNVGFDQRLGESVPLDATFRDEAGETVTIGSLLRDKPAVLALVYYECPMLCTLVLNGLVSAMNALQFSVGEEYDVIAISIDPRETPAMATAKKDAYLGHYRRAGAGAGWHFLTGDEEQITRVARAVGFRYQYVPERNEYAHAAGITVLTPKGRIARYFYGVEYPPRDLRLGLIEAAENKIGSVVDQLLLYCYEYDPSTGRYSTAVLGAVRIGGALTVLAIGGFLLRAFRRERRGPGAPAAPPGALPGTGGSR